MSSRIIYILESPSAGDFLMDRNETRTLPGLLELAGIRAVPATVVNAESLKSMMEVIVELIKTESHQPIIHLSTHGDESGIALTDGFIKWKALREELTPVAKATCNKLLVCLSACHGLNAIKMAYTDGQEVFEDLVGPRDKISWSDSALAFACFYNLFLQKNLSLKESVNRMNRAVGFDKPVFETVAGLDVRAQYIQDAPKRLLGKFRSILNGRQSPQEAKPASVQ
jgi:hypothetical protein